MIFEQSCGIKFSSNTTSSPGDVIGQDPGRQDLHSCHPRASPQPGVGGWHRLQLLFLLPVLPPSNPSSAPASRGTFLKCKSDHITLLLNTLGSNSQTTAQILNSLTPKSSSPSSPHLWFPSKHNVLKLYWSFLTLSSSGQLQIAVSVLDVFSCLGCSFPLPPLAREHLFIAQSSKQLFPCTPS